MDYRTLGRTGLRVYAIALGTVELGLDYGVPVAGEHLRPSEASAALLLNQALDLGINYIDTARGYGASEEVIGRALRGRRNEYILASKLAPIRDEELSDRELCERVKASLADSLRNLQTDTIDLLQIHHAPADLIRRGRVVAAMQEAQAAGQCRFIGASTYGEEAALAVLADGRYDTLQIAYNVVDRHLEQRVLPQARQKDVGVVVRSVLLRGVLTHRYNLIPDQLAELRAAIAQVDALVGPAARSLPEMAYRYVLAQPAVSTALVGTSRLEELQAALAYAALGPLPPELLARIRAVTISDLNQCNPGTWPNDLGAWQSQAAPEDQSRKTA
jgi:1-deoxyxylulose-5-phosphate synthase